MVTGVVDALFLDTNVLVYATVPTAPLYGAATTALSTYKAGGYELWISRQIIREYLATLSRPQIFSPGISSAQLVQQVLAFQTQFLIADENGIVSANLLNLVATIPIHGKQVHDANIVATMQAHGISKLLTHNIADFARFGSIITVVPLVP